MATQKDIALNIKVKFEGANTVQELEEVLNDINKELEEVEQGSEAFEILTDTAKKATNEVKEVNAKVKDLNGQSATLKQGMQGLSGVTQIFGGAVGDLFGKLQGATDQMGKLTNVFRSSTSSIGGSSKALRIFKVALASTGIGLLIIALGSLVSYFTNTQRGADKVSKALAGLKAGVAVIVDRFSSLGEGLIALFKGDFSEAGAIFKKAVSGIADEISREAKEAVSLENRLQKLEQREIQLIEVQAKRRAEIEKMKLLAQENFENADKAANYISRAIELERQQANEQIAIAKERASIIKANVGLGESMNEDLRASAEANARVIELEAERDSKLKELTSQLRGFGNAQKSANEAVEDGAKAREKAAADAQAQAEKQAAEAREKEFSKAISDLQDYYADRKLIISQNFIDGLISESEYASQLSQLEDEHRQAELIALDDYGQDKTQKEQEIADKIIAIKKDENAKIAEANAKLKEKEENDDIKAAEKKESLRQERIALAQGLYNDLKALSQTFFDDTEEGQKKAFEFNKMVSTAEAIVQTYLSASKAYTSQLIPGDPTSIVRAQIAAGLAVASGLARVATIQRTQFNSTSSSGADGGGDNTPSNSTLQRQQSTTPNVPIIETGGEGQKIKVYVTETDIRNTTKKMTSIYSKAIVTE